MPRLKCSVVCCANSHVDMKVNGISFFNFPEKAELAEEWEKRCAQPKPIRTFQARICSDHFTERDYVDQARTRMKTLNKHCVPTLNLPDPEKFSVRPKLTRKRRRRRRKNHMIDLSTHGTDSDNQSTDFSNHSMNSKEIGNQLNSNVRTILKSGLFENAEKSSSLVGNLSGSRNCALKAENQASSIELLVQELASPSLTNSSRLTLENSSPSTSKSYEMKTAAVTNERANYVSAETNCFQVDRETPFQVGATPFPADASRFRSSANAMQAESSPTEGFEADSSVNESLETDFMSNEGLEAGSSSSKKVASDEIYTEISPLELEIIALKRKLSKKKKKNARLKMTVRSLHEQMNQSKDNVYQMHRHILGILMSETEMDAFLGVSVIPNWTALEIAKAAIVIYYNKRCFNFMSKVLKYPMPNFRAVKLRCQNAHWRPQIVKQMAEYMRQIDKVEAPNEPNTELSEHEINNLLDNLFE